MLHHLVLMNIWNRLTLLLHHIITILHSLIWRQPPQFSITSIIRDKPLASNNAIIQWISLNTRRLSHKPYLLMRELKELSILFVDLAIKFYQLLSVLYLFTFQSFQILFSLEHHLLAIFFPGRARCWIIALHIFEIPEEVAAFASAL